LTYLELNDFAKVSMTVRVPIQTQSERNRRIYEDDDDDDDDDDEEDDD